jgi:hypothetical protein
MLYILQPLTLTPSLCIGWEKEKHKCSVQAHGIFFSFFSNFLFIIIIIIFKKEKRKKESSLGTALKKHNIQNTW